LQFDTSLQNVGGVDVLHKKGGYDYNHKENEENSDCNGDGAYV
jgi:hypothetical protein